MMWNYGVNARGEVTWMPVFHSAPCSSSFPTRPSPFESAFIKCSISVFRFTRTCQREAHQR